jgi:hypothetical protein
MPLDRDFAGNHYLTGQDSTGTVVKVLGKNHCWGCCGAATRCGSGFDGSGHSTSVELEFIKENGINWNILIYRYCSFIFTLIDIK